jgi:hypothetical protein
MNIPESSEPQGGQIGPEKDVVMSIDRQPARNVLGLLSPDEMVLRGEFPDLSETLNFVNNILETYLATGQIPQGLGEKGEMDFKEIMADDVQKTKVMIMYQQFSFVLMDLSLILTILDRLEWQKEQLAKNLLGDFDWTEYVGSDVYLFHVVLRSLFDHIARIVMCCADKPEYRKNSFNDIYKKAIDGNLDNIINADIVDLIKSCKWFCQIRAMRDRLVHGYQKQKAVSSAIIESEVIGIIVLKHCEDGDLQKWNVDEELRLNENVIDFELYSGWLLGNLIDFLEKFSAAVFKTRWTDKDEWLFSVKKKCDVGGRWQVAHKYIRRVADN